MVVVDVYVSPNSGWAAFVEFLDGIDPLLPRQQVGMLRQQGVRGKAARRARHSAGLGVGTDPVGHRVRRGTALPAASGPGHGVLRALVLGATPVDDTLVLVEGRGWHETLRIGEIATASTIHAVRGLGLGFFPTKSETIWVDDKNRRGTPPPGLSINTTD